MRLSKPLLAASLVASFSSNALAEALSGKWDCLTEKSAGVMSSTDGSRQTAEAITFNEKHKHFVLSISPAPHDKNWCRQTLNHWTPILERDGKFNLDDKPFAGSSSSDPSKMYDMRRNIGPHCFSSLNATIKFFDRDHETHLVSYDYYPNDFEGSPGNWLSFYEGPRSFQAGETIDAGPVVYTGICERLD